MERTSHERIIGIDLLRIVSMLMIVVLHILKQGGILAHLETGTLRYQGVWLLEYACLGAVNCYALISGFVGIRSRHRPRNLILLWMQVAFYTVIITFITWLFSSSSLKDHYWLNAFFPISTHQYWYFSAYALLFVMMPALNMIVEHFSRRALERLMLGFYFFVGICEMFARKDAFKLSNGYTAWWLAFLYLLGAYIRTYRPFAKIRKQAWWLFGGVALLWAMLYDLFTKTEGHAVMSYTAPPVMLLSLAVFNLCVNCKCRGSKALIQRIAPASFSVYLIHTNPILWDVFMKDRFVLFARLPLPILIIMVGWCTVGIYLACTLIDFVRMWIFHKAHIGRFIPKIERLLLKILPDEAA